MQWVKEMDTAKIFHSWATALATARIKHFRSVQLWLDVKKGGSSRVAHVDLTFSPDEGLGTKFSDHLQPKPKDLLQNYIAGVEKQRKVLGLQGEAITMALIGNNDIWNYGTLRAN